MIEIINLTFAGVVMLIGSWTFAAWLHKQIYTFKMSLKIKKALKGSDIHCNYLEAFWRAGRIMQKAGVKNGRD